MKYFAYVLRGDGNKFYKGVTNDLNRRFNEHQSGHTATTSKMKNLAIAYYEEFDNFNDARKREVYFKSAAGRRFLKSKLGR